MTEERESAPSSPREIEVVHIVRLGKPTCPVCGQGLERDGGSVVAAGSWEDGPCYWLCEDDGAAWGHA